MTTRPTFSFGLMLPAAAIASTLLFGCSEHKLETQRSATLNPAAQGAQGESDELALTDSEILGVLATAHEAEIIHGHMVADKLSQEALQSYAGDMIMSHTRAQVGLSKLTVTEALDVASSPYSQELSNSDSVAAGALEQEPTSPALDRKYVLAEVSHHQELIELIDHVLLPGTQSDALRAELQRTRNMTHDHLRRANALAEQLPVDTRASL